MLNQNLSFTLLIVFFYCLNSSSSYGLSGCRSGAVFVQCDWEPCNRSWPASDQLSKQPVLQLFSNGRLLNASRVYKSKRFTVDLQYIPVVRLVQFACVWRNTSTELCRRNVTVDLATINIPQPQNVSFAFYGNRTSIYKLIRLQFQTPTSLSDKTKYTVSVFAMNVYAKYCPVQTKDAIVFDTRPCQTRKGEVVCFNLLKWLHHFPRIYKADVSSVNTFGICTKELLCQRERFADIYGNLMNVNVTNKVSKQFPSINVSWEYPPGLDYAAINVIISVRYCKLGSKCFFINESRSFPREKIKTFAMITRYLEFDTVYEVQLCYIIKSVFVNISPWTKPVKIRTLDRLPGKPKLTKCLKTKRNFLIEWKDYYNQSTPLSYHIKIEASDQSYRVVNFPASTCHYGLCKFLLKRSSDGHTRSLRFSVSGCSNSGCNFVDVSHCTFKGSAANSPLSVEESVQTKSVKIVVSSFGGLILFALCAIAAHRWRKQRQQEDRVPVIFPRNYSDCSNSDDFPVNHEPYTVLQ